MVDFRQKGLDAAKEPTELEVRSALALLQLRLREATAFRKHLRSILTTWVLLAAASWALTFAALTLAIWPYLNTGRQVPDIISGVSAFIVVLTALFAMFSSYRLTIAASAVSEASLQIDHAKIVAETLAAEPIKP